MKRTISTASGLRNGSFSSEHRTYISFDSPDPDRPESIVPSEIPEDVTDDYENEYDSGMREIAAMQNLSVRRRSSQTSRISRRMSSISGALGMLRPSSNQSGESRRSESTYENLKLHKEVIDQVKHQMWPLDKKLRIIKQAKQFVVQHEKEMQNQLKSEKSFCSYVQQGRLKIVQYSQLSFRWLQDHAGYLIPWEGRIKRIESQFGSVVSSYFVFLRWVFYVNFMITLIIASFIILPEVLSGYWENTGVRKKMLPIEQKTSKNLKVLWDFEGILRYSPMFYGFYSNQPANKTGYEGPNAYFIVMMVVYTFSFIIILKKMKKNNKQSKLAEKDDEATFTWKVFSSWDYGIANVEAAHNKVSAIVMGIREALIEEAAKEKEQEQNWKIIAKRGSAHFFFLLCLVGSAYCVVLVVDRSTQPEADSSFYRQNEVTIVMSLIGAIIPKMFGLIELLEAYHPRKAMQWMLGRIMVLNLLSLYSLIFALVGKTQNMVTELHNFKMMNDSSLTNGRTTVLAMAESVECFPIPVPCHVIEKMKGHQEFGLKYHFDRDEPIKDNVISPKELFNVRIKDSLLEEKYRKELELNNTDLLDTMISNISDTLIQRDKSARLRMLWENLTFIPPENSTGDCTQEECKIECQAKCSHLCEIFFSCAADGGNSDLVADFETKRLRELTQSLVAVINVLESKPLKISTGQKDLLDCMQCFSFTFLTNDVLENETVADIFANISKGEQLLVTKEDKNDGLIPLEEKTCQKEICRKIWEEKYIPKDEVSGFTEDCKTAAENYIKDLEKKLKLRKLCWETMFGQELVKLTVMDMVFLVMAVIIGDLFRSIFLRVMNYCWFWDLERTFPGYPEFDVAENILHTVNNQGMVWMGLFMAPGLPILNLIKLVMIFYIKSWAVLVTNVPHETVFKATDSNNFYLLLLLLMLFLCILPVAYTLVWLKPSWHCGPFSEYDRIYHVSTKRLLEILPSRLHPILDYITSPGIIIPTLVLLVLTIWYLLSLKAMLRESNEDLKNQLHHERTEGRRKLVAGRKKSLENKPISQKWSSILPNVSTENSSKSKIENTVYASIQKSPGVKVEQVDDIERSSKEQQLLNNMIHAKIQRLERPSMSSIFNPSSSRCLTPCPALLDAESDKHTNDDEVFKDNDNESKMTDDFSSTDNRDVTDLDDDQNLASSNESELMEKAKTPKIWISKSASMEHDLE